MSGRMARAAARLMAMDDATWRRHANPWSGWTRILTTLPLLTLAIWSRAWIGPWAVPATAAALAWIWLNPRLFAEPARLDAWVSRAVMGERILAEPGAPIPARHTRAARVLSAMSLPGAALWAWGLWALWWEGAVLGGALAVLPKLWFCDRMVWLHADWTAAGRAVPGFEDVPPHHRS
jgi:hypothetical protein